MKKFNEFNNLDEMLQCESYHIQYHIINTDKDIDEMIECNNAGLFGCSHGEFMECWEEFLNTLSVWESKYDAPEEKIRFDISRKVYNTVIRDIRKCEKYHIEHFSYNDII